MSDIEVPFPQGLGGTGRCDLLQLGKEGQRLTVLFKASF